MAQPDIMPGHDIPKFFGDGSRKRWWFWNLARSANRGTTALSRQTGQPHRIKHHRHPPAHRSLGYDYPYRGRDLAPVVPHVKPPLPDPPLVTGITDGLLLRNYSLLKAAHGGQSGDHRRHDGAWGVGEGAWKGPHGVTWWWALLMVPAT